MAKTIAQTPAPPSDRIKGSKVNKKGSATAKNSSSIQLSSVIIGTLKRKLEEFKKSNPQNKKITLNDLKAVYRRGSGAYSGSHRPNISRAGWSYARVNKFLEKAAGKKVKAAYVQDDDLLKYEEGGKITEQPRDLRKLRNFDSASKGAEWLTLKDIHDDYDKENMKKADRWIDLVHKNQKIKKLTKKEFEEFKELTRFCASKEQKEDYEEGGKTDIRYEKGGLIAPNGKPSNLTPEQYKLVRTPEFKAWFGDWENDSQNASKVIDENGEPLVLWHFAKRLQYELDKFYTFKVDRQLGSHFGTIKQAQNLKYIPSGQNERRAILAPVSDFRYYQVFLNIKNPIRLKDVGIFEPQTLLDAIGNENIKTNEWEFINNYNKINKDSILDRVKYITKTNYGYDGVVYLNRYESDAESSFILSLDDDSDTLFRKKVPSAEDSWIAFNPNQIKLADGTNTTFDETNEDIRYEKGGLIAPNGKKSNLTSEQYELVRTPEFKAWFGDWENDPQNASKIVDDNGEPKVYYQGQLYSEYPNGNYLFKKRNNGIFFTGSKKIAYTYGAIKSVFINSRNPKDIRNYYGYDNKKISNSSRNDNKYYFKSSEVKDYLNSDPNVINFYEDVIDKYGEGEVIEIPDRLKYTITKYKNKQEIKDFLIQTSSKGFKFLNFRFKSSIWDLIAKYIKNSEYDGVLATDEDYLREDIADSVVVYNSNQIKLADGTNTTFDSANPDIRYEEGGKTLEKWYRKYNGDDAFAYNKEGKSKYGAGIYFSNQPNSRFEGEKEIEVMVQYKNPKIYENTKSIPNINFIKDSKKEINNFADRLFDEGYDAIIVKHSDTFGDELIIRDKSLIIREGETEMAKGGKTFDDKELLARWKKGESIGFTAEAHLKAKGLIPRADGKKRKSEKYMEEGGELDKKITCVNCGWHWKESQTEQADKYICHKCGFDNTLFYPLDYAKGGKLKGTGDCYYMAGQFAMDNVFTPKKIEYIGTPYLVHAEVRGQGKIEGIRYGHAWIEDDVNVYDFSNNREIIIPKVVYYALGNIETSNPKKYVRYTFPEARQKMLKTGTYGCWDLDVQYADGGKIEENLYFMDKLKTPKTLDEVTTFEKETKVNYSNIDNINEDKNLVDGLPAIELPYTLWVMNSKREGEAKNYYGLEQAVYDANNYGIMDNNSIIFEIRDSQTGKLLLNKVQIISVLNKEKQLDFFKFADGGEVIEEYEIEIYLKEQQEEALSVLLSQQTRIRKATICFDKIENAEIQMLETDSGLEKNTWQAVKNIWEDCLEKVKNDYFQSFEKGGKTDCSCGGNMKYMTNYLEKAELSNKDVNKPKFKYFSNVEEIIEKDEFI